MNNVTAFTPRIGTMMCQKWEENLGDCVTNLLTVKETTTGSLDDSPSSAFFMRYPPGGLGKTRSRNLNSDSKIEVITNRKPMVDQRTSLDLRDHDSGDGGSLGGSDNEIQEFTYQ